MQCYKSTVLSSKYLELNLCFVFLFVLNPFLTTQQISITVKTSNFHTNKKKILPGALKNVTDTHAYIVFLKTKFLFKQPI